MPFIDMISELTGVTPKLPYNYARTLINRAASDTYRKNLWSFQLFETNWVSPNIITAGKVAVTQGSNTVTFNAAAQTVINAIGPGPFPTPITSRQFRVAISTVYSIWAYNSTTGVATLDRPYTDVTAAATGYTVFQCYYAPPYSDFKGWINVRDMQNFNNLNIYHSRKDMDFRDPQRTLWWIPTDVVPYAPDQNPASPTYGYLLTELWGPPMQSLVYQNYGLRKGAPLVKDTDTLPLCIGEDCIMALARSYAYEWAESNKGDIPREQGSDYKFLMGLAKADYKRLYGEYRRDDREQVDNWYDVRRPRMPFPSIEGFYNSISNTAWPGVPW